MGWKRKCWEAAESFRKKYVRGKWDSLPLDIFSVVELELGLDVIPFDDLAARYEVEAALTKDFTGIYVDADTYVFMERGPEWKLKRLRFSFAHEVGHYELHRDLAEGVSFQSVDAFGAWSRDHDGEKENLERQADEFAGRLLVPIERLEEEFARFASMADEAFSNWRRDGNIRRKAAERIAERFGVSTQVVEIRFDREGLWPPVF